MKIIEEIKPLEGINSNDEINQRLNKLIEEVRRRLKKECSTLELFSQQYTQDYWEKEKIIEDVRKSLMKVKEKVLKQVQRIFEELQRNLNLKINQFHDSLHSEYQNMQAKLQHSYETNVRKLNIIQCDDQVSQLNSTRPSMKYLPQISSERSEEQEKNKYLHPSMKIVKTVIEHFGNRQSERMQFENKEIRKDIDRLKKCSLKVRTQVGLTDYIQKIREFVNLQEFVDEENIYYLPSRPKVDSRRK